MRGAEAVVHLAGAIRAPSRAAFLAVNAGGRSASPKRRRPTPGGADPPFLARRAAAGLSPYAESKALGEQAALCAVGSLGGVVVVRPPAVYGPGDHATLPVLAEPRARLAAGARGQAAARSLLFAPDLGRPVAALANGQAPSEEHARAGRRAPRRLRLARPGVIAQDRLARRVRTVGVPRSALAIAAGLAERYTALQARFPLPSTGGRGAVPPRLGQRLAHDGRRARAGGRARVSPTAC